MRARGGKHNDLDNVGYTARTTPSSRCSATSRSGDYFKDRAIELAWNLITRISACRAIAYGHRLCGRRLGVQSGKKIAGLPEEKIIRIAGSDNFLADGDLGPCGPCSEIFTTRPAHSGRSARLPRCRGRPLHRDMESRVHAVRAAGRRQARRLPKPSIDTGMGLSASPSAQGTHDNYKIDLFGAIISHVADLTDVDADGPQGVSHRVIVDHLRAASFLIADGVLPSNERARLCAPRASCGAPCVMPNCSAPRTR